MKKLFTFLSLLWCSTCVCAQPEIHAEVSCPPDIFIFENGGASTDSSFVAGSPNNVYPTLALYLDTGSIDAGDMIYYVDSKSRFVYPVEDGYDANERRYWYQGFTLINQPPNAPGYLLMWNLTPPWDSVRLLLDMDYYDQDSIVFVGLPWQDFEPCHPYGLFMWYLGHGIPDDTVINPDNNSINDFAVVPVIFDCFGRPGGNNVLSLYKQNVTLSIFPNPAIAQLNVQQYFERNAKVSVAVTDLSGRRVLYKDLGKMQGDQHISVDIAELPPGVYMLEVSSIYLKATGKFQKR